MIRTIISLPREIKVWLDDYSKKNNRPTAETIREALMLYKKKVDAETKDVLKISHGLWKSKKADASKYIESIRDEWK
ncbi:MAG TPA: hypothetical protein ENN33_13500 [Ignavibacteria bacterium]|nr:hypothetical protein [Ignavibacteria bacterium]